MKPKMVYVLTPDQVIMALANYLTDELGMEIENGVMGFEQNNMGGITIEVYDVEEQSELH